MSRYGQYNVPEPPRNVALLHRHTTGTLRKVDHEPPCPVLDQQTLVAQGITVAKIVPGARAGTNALGSCTANATVAHLSGILQKFSFQGFLRRMAAVSFASTWTPYTAHVGEEAAIGFYHAETELTGTTAQEWPPTDCGSSGPYIAEAAKRMGFITSQLIAHTPQDLVSLLQRGSVLQGGPFFNAWESPAANGFVDGEGIAADLEAAIQSGVAGGHETLITAVESVELSATGQVVPESTVLRVRNSWGASWGDHGSFRIHLSTLAALARYYDWRRLV